MLKDCCAKPENLGEPQKTDKEDLVVRYCSVCGLRHFELSVDPLVLNLRGA